LTTLLHLSSRRATRSSPGISNTDNHDPSALKAPDAQRSLLELRDDEDYSGGPLQSQFAYSRKEKSLGELCRRFLGLYGGEGKSLLYLDQCTRELAVERRRIYDIINILESFQVINRQAKNAYHWKGIHKIVKSIERHIVRLSVMTVAGALHVRGREANFKF
jgi:hypothetical protein